MFGVLPRQLRGDTGRNEHTFWATRWKRAGMMDMVIKPNGFFNVGKRGFKPNGLFNIKRMGFKPNMFNVNKKKISISILDQDFNPVKLIQIISFKFIVHKFY